MFKDIPWSKRMLRIIIPIQKSSIISGYLLPFMTCLRELTLFDMETEKELDMGGTFDWFGPESHPDFCGNPDTGEYTGDNSKSPTGRMITAEQFANRMILRRAMLRHGFRALDTEWWHFTLDDEPFPETYFTFPVKELAD